MQQVHPNYIKASKILLLQMAVAIVSYFLYRNDIHVKHSFLVPFVMAMFWALLFYLVRTGVSWVKYILLFGFAWAHTRPSNWAAIFEHGPLRVVMAIIGICISIWVIWLLFTIPKQQAPNDEPRALS